MGETMESRIVLVSGLMRTGTSLVSRQLHRMGVPMGTTMSFPSPTEYGQEDWEDVTFSKFMLDAFLQGYGAAWVRKFWRDYMISRSGPAVWGVKSPFALPFLDELKNVSGDRLRVVYTTRDIAKTFESMANQHVSEGVYQIQHKLIPYLANMKPDLTIDITESWSDPSSVKLKLENLIRS